MIRPVFAAAALALLAPSALAQETADRVVVEGARIWDSLPEQTRNFVHKVAQPVNTDFGIARWDGALCIGVENAESEAAAQFLADRISMLALELGLSPGEPGCEPDLAILFTSDGDALAQYLVESQPRMFRPFGGAQGTNLGLNALHTFQHSGAPVRWWHVTMPVDQRGWPAVRLRETEGPPAVRGANSFITQLIRARVMSAVVIVDARQMEGVNWAQLADYLAMVSLAQIDANVDMSGYDSILNLFSGAGPAGLTEWDRAYLAALYDFDQYRVWRSQRGALAQELENALESEPAAPAPTN